MTKTVIKLRGQALALGLAQVLIEPLREVAKAHGYALAEHGSQRRDIDLVAIPWTADAGDPIVLAEAIRAKTEEMIDIAFPTEHENTEYFWRGEPGAKPHGRLTWAFHLGGGPYIDLSVMPPWADPYGETSVLPEWPEGTQPKTSADFAALKPIPPMVPFVSKG